MRNLLGISSTPTTFPFLIFYVIPHTSFLIASSSKRLAHSYLSTISLPPSSNTTSPFRPCLCLPLILMNRFTFLLFNIFIPVMSFNTFLFCSCNFPQRSFVLFLMFKPPLLSFIACLSSAGILSLPFLTNSETYHLFHVSHTNRYRSTPSWLAQ